MGVGLASRSFRRFESARSGILSLILGLGFFAAALLSIELSRAGEGSSGIWLASAFAFAIMVRNDTALVDPLAYSALFTASMAANMLGSSWSLGAALLFSGANLFQFALSLSLIGRYSGELPLRIETVRDFASVLGLAGVAAVMAGAVFAISAELGLGWPLAQTAWTWISSNILGFAFLLPVMLVADRQTLARLARPLPAMRLAAISAGCAVVAGVSLISTEFFFAPAILPLLLVAPRLAVFEQAVVCATTGAALIGFGMAGYVPGLDGDIAAFAHGFQLSVVIITLIPFLGALLIRQILADRRRIAESEQRFRRAMKDSSIGGAVIALDGRIEETNPALVDMLGYSPDEIAKLTFSDIIHSEAAGAYTGIMERARSGAEGSFHFETRLMRKDGSGVAANIAASVICDGETRAPVHLVLQVEDIQARKDAEARIADAEMRWNFALANAGQGFWELDYRKDWITYSSAWKAILGYAEDELDGDTRAWFSLVHPEDVARVADLARAHVKGKTPCFEAEFRMRHKAGHWMWILDRGVTIERDAAGRAVRAIGTMTDITRRKQAEERLASSAAMLADEKERLRVTLNSIGDAVICADAANLITFMNPVAEKLTRMNAEEALGKPLDTVYVCVDEETGERLDSVHVRSAGAQSAEQDMRAVLVRRDGTRCSIREVISPILAEGNEFGGSVIVFQDFTDARSLQRELAYAAAHDALTGLANRSSFLRSIESLAEQARVKGTEHQFLFIDLDHFKHVNDTRGHAAGDALLREVAASLRGAVRAGDVAARLGGDEFAVVLKDCSVGAATQRAEKLAADICGLRKGDDFSRFGASIGMTSIRPHCGPIEEIIARADEACYGAKAAGRGRVIWLEPLVNEHRPQKPMQLAG